jgi:hypothetical protein
MVHMRSLRAPRHFLQHRSSTRRVTQSCCEEPFAQDRAADVVASRHDAQMFAARRVSADPYSAWLQQREADRRREALRLNPRAAWDDLKSPSFTAVGRG